MIESLLQDLRFAARQFRRRPGFVLLAATTLGLGIGATTAVYTIVRAVLLQSPYRNPNEIVIIWDNRPAHDQDQVRQMLASPADFDAYRSARSLEYVAFGGRVRPVLEYGGTLRERLAGMVTAPMFRDTLGVDAALGRTFTEDDEQGGCVVVMAHEFWSSVLGANPKVVGQTLNFDKTSCTVLGVMPQAFTFFPNTADMWFLLGHAPTTQRANVFGAVCARIKSGYTVQQVHSEIAALHKAANADRPANGDDISDGIAAVEPIQQELTALTNSTLRSSLLVTLGAVTLLLLIACLNVANLSLARLSERQRELVVRAALGSGRGRLMRQMLTEGMLLAMMGGTLGVGLAAAAVRGFRWLNPVELPPHAGSVSLDLSVLLFAFLLTSATALVFGLLPAFKASRLDLIQSLKFAGRGFRGGSERGHSWRRLVAVEIALSFILLIGAASLMRSVLRMASDSLGFDQENIVSVNLTFPMPQYRDTGARTQFTNALLERTEALPGVARAVPGWAPPWDPRRTFFESKVEVRGLAVSETADVESQWAVPGLFEILRTPLLRGRYFEERDLNPGAPRVVIVSQYLGDKYFGGKDPVGQQIRIVDSGEIGDWATVVGVVGTWKHMANDALWRDSAVLFSPGRGLGQGQTITIRTQGDVGAVVGEVRRQAAALDASVEAKVEKLQDRISGYLLYPRFRAGLLIFFGISALLLAGVGLHGVLAQLVTQRTAEFGVRRAVGAQTSDLLWLVARQGGTPVLIGLALGWAGAYSATRVLESMLTGIEPMDLRLFGVVTVAMLLATFAAMTLPARRAARVDPLVALRDE